MQPAAQPDLDDQSRSLLEILKQARAAYASSVRELETVGPNFQEDIQRVIDAHKVYDDALRTFKLHMADEAWLTKE